jgi:cytochrome c oxidase cbb3-type subunit 3
MSEQDKHEVGTAEREGAAQAAPHDHDGIQEHDNPLPSWWLAIFILSVVFGYGYWLHFHVAKTGRGLVAEFADEQAEAARRAAGSTPLSDGVLLALAGDPVTVQSGERVFKQLCAPCHGDRAEGKIGPNLTDDYWLHGNKPTEIYKSVSGGFVEKGMPSWLPTLGAERTRQVVSFVLTQRGKNIPGKEPQGDRIGAVPR